MEVKDYKQEYYERPEHWAEDFLKKPWERERIEETVKVVPSDVQSVLEVGCGNGAFINYVIGKYPKLVGLDSSKEALKHVRAETVFGSIDNLPFKLNNFDLIVCLETLEHLPQEVFVKGLLELQRVSKKYILVSVPNNEILDISLEKCPACHCWFHPFFHIRSFDENKLKELFDSFEPQTIKPIGAPAVNFPKTFTKPYQILKLIFNYPPFHPYSICPTCGYRIESGTPSQESSSGSFKKKVYDLLKSAAKIKKTKKTSLLALYKKKSK